MKKHALCLLTILLVFQSCSTSKHLKSSEKKLAMPLKDKLVQFHFEEQLGELGHNSQPWETSNYVGKGNLWLAKNSFLKQDTLINSRGRNYFSKTDYRNKTLLYLDYGDTDLLPITNEVFYEKIINTARYSPTILLHYFIDNETKLKTENSATHYIYSLKVGNFLTKIFINKTNLLIDKINYLSYHELYGDVMTTYNYSSYNTSENLTFPSLVSIEKINGKITDQIKIKKTQSNTNIEGLLEKPINYKLVEEKQEEVPVLKVTKHNDYIYFINLEHTDDRVMVVEFDDYMLVAEAPLNSKNGELIINVVQKIAPQKPIKYFIFGHHHPHYLGGLRAFVHNEATILCTNISKDYVEYIANAPHTINPDSLQIEPKKIKTQVITDSLSLGNTNKMKIYFIGEKSAHTKDFLIYYFPNEKLLFQDDLCWIASEGEITKAGNRQQGLYDSIIELGLDVNTIIQSWPVNNNKVKTIIPFEDLKKSVLMK